MSSVSLLFSLHEECSGMVEAVAETLILDVAVWSTATVDKTDGHREVRKLAANALTNLTFGQVHSKRLLCQYTGFVDSAVLLLETQPSLVQVSLLSFFFHPGSSLRRFPSLSRHGFYSGRRRNSLPRISPSSSHKDTQLRHGLEAKIS